MLFVTCLSFSSRLIWEQGQRMRKRLLRSIHPGRQSRSWWATPATGGPSPVGWERRPTRRQPQHRRWSTTGCVQPGWGVLPPAPPPTARPSPSPLSVPLSKNKRLHLEELTPSTTAHGSVVRHVSSTARWHVSLTLPARGAPNATRTTWKRPRLRAITSVPNITCLGLTLGNPCTA